MSEGRLADDGAHRNCIKIFDTPIIMTASESLAFRFTVNYFVRPIKDLGMYLSVMGAQQFRTDAL